MTVSDCGYGPYGGKFIMQNQMRVKIDGINFQSEWNLHAGFIFVEKGSIPTIYVDK